MDFLNSLAWVYSFLFKVVPYPAVFIICILFCLVWSVIMDVKKKEGIKSQLKFISYFLSALAISISLWSIPIDQMKKECSRLEYFNPKLLEGKIEDLNLELQSINKNMITKEKFKNYENQFCGGEVIPCYIYPKSTATPKKYTSRL